MHTVGVEVCSFRDHGNNGGDQVFTKMAASLGCVWGEREEGEMRGGRRGRRKGEGGRGRRGRRRGRKGEGLLRGVSYS